MVAIPISVGSRSGIRLQPARGLARALATAFNGDQTHADDVRHFGDAEGIWRVRRGLRTGAGTRERKV